MNDQWAIFCEESGDKQMPWKEGSSDFYIITSVLVKQENEQDFINVINDYKYRVLRLRQPLEWKRLRPRIKRDDVILGRFLKKVCENAPLFLVSNVICNKHETNGLGFSDRNTFMNYLYGLMFKRISWFLKTTNSTAKLTIDRNTDNIAQTSLHRYISMITRDQTGEHPRHSKPKWLNPEQHSVLGFSDFISGVSLRSLENYLVSSHQICNPCTTKRNSCIYHCTTSNFGYKKSYKYVVQRNYKDLERWQWKGLLYHPFEFKDNYINLFQPR